MSIAGQVLRRMIGVSTPDPDYDRLWKDGPADPGGRHHAGLIFSAAGQRQATRGSR